VRRWRPLRLPMRSRAVLQYHYLKLRLAVKCRLNEWNMKINKHGNYTRNLLFFKWSSSANCILLIHIYGYRLCRLDLDSWNTHIYIEEVSHFRKMVRHAVKQVHMIQFQYWNNDKALLTRNHINENTGELTCFAMYTYCQDKGTKRTPRIYYLLKVKVH